DGQSGTVTVVQRFGSGLELNVHFLVAPLLRDQASARGGEVAAATGAPPEGARAGSRFTPPPLPRRISLPCGAARGSWLGGSSADAPEARRRDEVGPLAGVAPRRDGNRPDETAASLTASSVRFRGGCLTFVRLDISRLPALALAPVADRTARYPNIAECKASSSAKALSLYVLGIDVALYTCCTSSCALSGSSAPGCMTTGRPHDAEDATGLARYRRSPVSGQAAHLALAVSLLPRPDPPDLFRPGLLLLSRGRDHPLSARGGPGRMHRGDQGQNLLSPRRHARPALRRAEPRHRHLHDLLRRPYQSDSLPRAAVLPGGGSDRYLQPSDARGGEEHSAGPARIHGFDGVPPTQSACPQSNLLRGSRPAVLRAPDRGPGHRPHHPLHAETESTRRPGSTLLTGPLRLAGRPDPSVVVRVRLRDGSGDGRPRGGGDRPDRQAQGRSDAIVEEQPRGDDAMNQVGIQIHQVTREARQPEP